MPEINLKLNSDLSGITNAFQQGDALIDKTNQSVQAFGVNGKKAFKSATDEADKFGNEIKKGVKELKGLDVATESVPKSVNKLRELRNEIKKLTSDAIALSQKGDITGSNEAIAKVGQLKDEIKDLQDAISAVSGNAKENLFNAIGSATSVAASGFEGATAAAALFGEKSEAVEKQILKLQAIQSLTRLAAEFGDIGDKIAQIKSGLSPLTGGLKTLYTSGNEGLKRLGKEGFDVFSKIGGVFSKIGAGAKSLFMNFGGGIKNLISSGVQGFKALGVAAAANPFGLVLIVITAIIGVMVALKDKVKPIGDLFRGLGEFIGFIGDKLQELGEALGIVSDATERKAKATIKNTESEITAIEKRYDREIALAEASGKDTEKLEKEKLRAVQTRVLNTFLILQQNLADGKKLSEDEQKQFLELQEKLKDIKNEFAIVNAKKDKEAFDKKKEKDAKALEDAKKNAEKLKQAQKDLQAFLIELAKKSDLATIELLSGEEKINAQRAQAQKEIELLKQTLIEKKKLARVNTKLTAEEAAEFDKLELLANAQQADSLIKLAIENSNIIAQQNKKEIDSELEFLNKKNELAILAVENQKKPKGLSEENFASMKQIAILKIKKQGAIDELQVRQDLIKEEAKLLILQINNELNALDGKNDELSVRRKEALQKNIEDIERNAAIAQDVLFENTKKTGQEAQKAVDDLNKKLEEGKGFDLAKALDIDPEKFKEILRQFSLLTNGISEITNAVSAKRLEALDEELKANEDRAKANDDIFQDLKDKQSEEEELQRQGLANNFTRIQEEIAAAEMQKKADIARAKEIQIEKKKIAKDQLIIDTALQASQLALAIATLFAEGSKFWIGPVPAGYIIAGIAAAGMIATFATSKAKAFKAINDSSGFKDGGYTGDAGESDFAGFVHGKEYVHTAKKTKKHRTLFDGIHNDDKLLIHNGVLELIRDTGIKLEPELPSKLAKFKDVVSSANANNLNINNNKGLEMRIDFLNEQVLDLSKQLKNKVTVLPNGNVVETFGNVTRVINKR